MFISFVIDGVREFYFYACEQIDVYNTENSKRVAAFILQQMEKIGLRKILALGTDNASTMTAAWKIISEYVKNKDEQIIIYSCACHMLHNFSKVVVKGKKWKDKGIKETSFSCNYFPDVFAVLTHVGGKLKKSEYQEWRVQDNKSISFPPSHTEIRWNSASNVTGYYKEDYEIIKQYLLTLTGRESTEQVKRFCTSAFHCKLMDFDSLLQTLHCGIRNLERDDAYLGSAYITMSQVDYALKTRFAKDYPEFIVEFDKLWNRSYTDITGVAFLLDPLALNIRHNTKHALHKALLGPISAHEASVCDEMVNNLGIPRDELNQFFKYNKDFHKNKNFIDAKYFAIEKQRV